MSNFDAKINGKTFNFASISIKPTYENTYTYTRRDFATYATVQNGVYTEVWTKTDCKFCKGRGWAEVQGVQMVCFEPDCAMGQSLAKGK